MPLNEYLLHDPDPTGIKLDVLKDKDVSFRREFDDTFLCCVSWLLFWFECFFLASDGFARGGELGPQFNGLQIPLDLFIREILSKVHCFLDRYLCQRCGCGCHVVK